MTKIKLKHVDCFVDRHGKRRYYFRFGKGSRLPIPGAPGSAEFMAVYHAALGDHGSAKTHPRGEAFIADGTFGRLVHEYFASPDYRRLALQTQTSYRNVIMRFLREENVSHRLVREMTRQHVQAIVARRAETPGAANDLLKKLRILLHFAIDNGWRKDDPTVRIKKFAGGEFHTWTDDEIAIYEKRWAVGTRERTAFGLLLFTGQRASDVAKMMWSEISSDGIWVVQRKTKAKLLVPIHPQLREILSVCEIGTGAILQTSFGAPFTAKGFSNFMAERIGKAGLAARCVTHGLRKAAARRLAEAGCSANEIASITGHATLEEVARYTKAAEQKKLAQAAMNRLTHVAPVEFPNLSEGLGNSDKKSNEINLKIRKWRSLRESNPSFQIENLTS